MTNVTLDISKYQLRTNEVVDDVASADEMLSVIAQARSGDSDAFSTIFRHYRRRIYGLTSGYFAPGADRDDLLQEATIGFFKAVRDFDPEKGDFVGFMILCVRRQLATFIKQATRRKHRPLNHSISIDAQLHQDSEKSLSEYLSAPDLGIDVTQSGIVAAIESLSAACSSLERNILLLYTTGHTYSDIVARLKVTPKAVNNALWRVKKKALRLGVWA